MGSSRPQPAVDGGKRPQQHEESTPNRAAPASCSGGCSGAGQRAAKAKLSELSPVGAAGRRSESPGRGW
eukprot:scaffold25360_cov122-Isochrysis_galbana.AAC.7